MSTSSSLQRGCVAIKHVQRITTVVLFVFNVCCCVFVFLFQPHTYTTHMSASSVQPPQEELLMTSLITLRVLLSTDKAHVTIVCLNPAHTDDAALAVVVEEREEERHSSPQCFVAKTYKTVPSSQFGSEFMMKHVVSRYMRERCVLARCLRHPNIVKLHRMSLVGADDELLSTDTALPLPSLLPSFHQQNSDVALRPIYLELMELGSLKDVCSKLRLRPNMTRDILCSFAKAVAVPCLVGLRHLHSMQLIHRDVKPENILLSRSGVVQWCDFDSCSFDNPETVDVGTKGYSAPEMRLNAGEMYTEKIDLWGMGCVLYWVVLGGDMSTRRDFDLDAIPDVELRDLLRRLLETDPDRRDNARDALLHEALCPALYKKTTVNVAYPEAREYFHRHHLELPAENTDDAAELKKILLLSSERIAVDEYDRLRAKYDHLVAFWRQRRAVAFLEKFLATWTDASFLLVA